MNSTRTQKQVAQRTVQKIRHPSAATTWADMAGAQRPIRWDWPGWLACGFLTILASQAGIGKSTLCLHLAATYMDGRAWPDGTPFTATPGKILWVESEGGQRVNLQRLLSWGLDPAQIITPSDKPGQNFRPASLDDFGDLVASATRRDVRLIVCDSLSGLLPGSNSPRAVRSLLVYLAVVAGTCGKPVLLTHHLRKRTSLDRQLSLDRLLGSSVISQVPRLIWGLDIPDPAQPEQRRLAVIKNNLAPFPDPLGFRIDDQGLHFGPPPQPPAPISQLEQATTFLAELLASGPLPAMQVKEAAEAAGLAPTTLKRAKKRLRIKSNKRPHEWLWQLPVKSEQ